MFADAKLRTIHGITNNLEEISLLITVFLMYSWMTTTNGYLRLALLKFSPETRPIMILDDKICRLENIVNFIASVYVLMFLRIHMKPRAPDGPGNMIFN